VKLKAFFWKRVLLPADAPDTVIWKRIKEEKVEISEIEALYVDSKAAAPSDAGAGSVKVTGPSKKTFFSPEENQKL